jgi:hypothetical protein
MKPAPKEQWSDLPVIRSFRRDRASSLHLHTNRKPLYLKRTLATLNLRDELEWRMSRVFRTRSAAVLVLATIGGVMTEAEGAWGLQFQVRMKATDSWSSSVIAKPGDVALFRFGSYSDPGTLITEPTGPTAALSLCRFTGSNQWAGFLPGDFINPHVVRTIMTGNKLLTQINENTIGTSDALSYGSQLFVGFYTEAYKEIYIGSINIGPAEASRTLTFKNKTYGADDKPGQIFWTENTIFIGKVFPPSDYPNHTDLNATVQVISSCPSDFNGDRVVDDSDYQIFVFAYDTFVCEDPSMPPGCPSDLNRDGVVDNEDALVFVAAYNTMLCQ